MQSNMTGNNGTLRSQQQQQQQPQQAGPMSNLAAAIANAKLKKTPGSERDGGSETRVSGGQPMGGMASMMDEMAKTLARRRAQAEGGDVNKSVNGCSPSKDTTDTISTRYEKVPLLLSERNFIFSFVQIIRNVSILFDAN